jgi:hypothetical protein
LNPKKDELAALEDARVRAEFEKLKKYVEKPTIEDSAQVKVNVEEVKKEQPIHEIDQKPLSISN